MRTLLARLYRVPVFLLLGRPLFRISRFPRLEPVSLWMARVYARIVLGVLGRRPQSSPRDLADEWNRLMPEPRSAFPVLDADTETARVEIRVRCPLRGSGDAEACWRSMEFDRALIAASGGRLVVMESQSVTGGDRCRLAIRPAGSDLDDLPVAHPRWRS